MRPFPSKGAPGPAPSGGSDGDVITRVAGVPAWAPPSGGSIASTDITDSTSVGRSVLTATDAAAARTAIGVSGGGTHDSGTLAARPVSPAAGDTYAVTSGVGAGDRYQCFVAGSWEALPSAPPPESIPVAFGPSADATQGTRATGGCSANPTALAVTGKALALTLTVIACVVSGRTGTVVLYDLTAAVAVATLTFTETSPTLKTASVAVPGAEHLYELRITCDGTTTAHYLTLTSAVLRASWS